MTDYLTVIQVLAIHEDQIEGYGGASGVRDLGLLEAALYRPQTGYYADLIEEAAALWRRLAQKHPCVDGNTRAVFAVLYTLLVINRRLIVAKAETTYAFIIGPYDAGRFDFDHLAIWLRNNTNAA